MLRSERPPGRHHQSHQGYLKCRESAAQRCIGRSHPGLGSEPQRWRLVELRQWATESGQQWTDLHQHHIRQAKRSLQLGLVPLRRAAAVKLDKSAHCGYLNNGPAEPKDACLVGRAVLGDQMVLALSGTAYICQLTFSSYEVRSSGHGRATTITMHVRPTRRVGSQLRTTITSARRSLSHPSAHQRALRKAQSQPRAQGPAVHVVAGLGDHARWVTQRPSASSRAEWCW